MDSNLSQLYLVALLCRIDLMSNILLYHTATLTRILRITTYFCRCSMQGYSLCCHLREGKPFRHGFESYRKFLKEEVDTDNHILTKPLQKIDEMWKLLRVRGLETPSGGLLQVQLKKSTHGSRD